MDPDFPGSGFWTLRGCSADDDDDDDDDLTWFDPLYFLFATYSIYPPVLNLSSTCPPVLSPAALTLPGLSLLLGLGFCSGLCSLTTWVRLSWWNWMFPGFGEKWTELTKCVEIIKLYSFFKGWEIRKPTFFVVFERSIRFLIFFQTFRFSAEFNQMIRSGLNFNINNLFKV